MTKASAPNAAPGWIKTACGRAKYSELAARPGALAGVRLAWFVAIAAVRDWPLPAPSQQSDSESES